MAACEKKEDVNLVVFCAYEQLLEFVGVLKRLGCKHVDWLVWHKTNASALSGVHRLRDTEMVVSVCLGAVTC